MDSRLQQDMARFYRVYQANAHEILHHALPPDAAAAVESQLSAEFELFRTSVNNRLSEEFND